VTYIELSAWFVGAAAVVAIVLSIATRHRPRLAAMIVTIVVLFLLTAVFDTIMIATGLFHYSPDHLLGLHIGLAPLEDFAYPLAGAILLPALWAALHGRRHGRRRGRRESTAPDGGAS